MRSCCLPAGLLLLLTVQSAAQTVEIVALRGDEAPGLTETYQGFDFTNGALDQFGNVAFLAGLTFPNAGFFTYRNGDSLLIVQENASGRRALDRNSLRFDGRYAFTAQVEVGGGGPPPTAAWVEGDAGPVSPYASVPGVPGASFLRVGQAASGRQFAVAGDHVAFFAQLVQANPSPNSSNDTGVWIGPAGAMGLAARKGSQMPGGPADVEFNTFGAVAINESGTGVFLANGNNDAFTQFFRGVYRSNGGAATLVDPGAFSDPTINQKGTIAYRDQNVIWINGTTKRDEDLMGAFGLVVAGFVLLENDSLVVVGDQAGVTKILRETPMGYLKLAGEGDPAVGLQGQTFTSIDQVSANTNGDVVFRGFYAPGFSGWWLADRNGALRLLVRRGSEFSARGKTWIVNEQTGFHETPFDAGVKVDGTGVDGYPTYFNENGDLLLNANLTEKGTTNFFNALILIPASAVIVNSTGDLNDRTPGDGACDTGNLISRDSSTEAECTLRAAIEETNALPGRDKIEFDIPDSDAGFSADLNAFVVSPESALPDITDQVDIEGKSGPIVSKSIGLGAFEPPLQILDGSKAGAGVDGLRLVAGQGSVRFLGVQNFDRYGLVVRSGANQIESNYIGVDTRGRAAPNQEGGISVESASGNRIGAPGKGNWIAGNKRWGVRISGAGSTGNVVESNLIGADLSGSQELANEYGGVQVDLGARQTRIGGPDRPQGNAIYDGVSVRDFNTRGVTVRNNVLAVPEIPARINPPTLPFDLGTDGPSCNPWTGGVGTNGGVTPPRVTGLGTDHVAGMTKPGWTVDVYRNITAGTEYGRYFSRHMEPVASGSANSDGYFDISLPEGQLPEGDLVTVTATDPDGNTSEPSQIRRPVIVVPGIGGSWIEALNGGDNLWVPLALTDAATDDRLVRMGMTVTGTSLEPILADGVLEEVGFPYRPIVVWLQNAGYPGSSTKWKASTGEPNPGLSMEVDLWRFANDWRLNQFQLARNLRDRVEWLTTQRDEVTRSCDVDLVAHSNGGVISAAFIRGFPEIARDRVVRYVSMAVPYMGATQAIAAHTKGYAFEIENQLPGYDPEWGKLLKMARNLIGAYALIPSKNYWTASAQFSDGRRAMMEDLRGGGLTTYDAVRKFLVRPKSKWGLERNAALLDKMSTQVQSLIDDWRDWVGPPHVFRIVGAKANPQGFRSSSTAVGWYSDANAFSEGRISGWRAEEGDEPDHELYRSAQMPILGHGDGTVPISSATLGRDNGRTDLSGVRLSGGGRNPWIEEFEFFPCDHVGLIGTDCQNDFSLGALERMTQIVKSSYEVLQFGGGKLEASPKSGIEGEENLLYVSGTNAIGVHVYDETGNHTGPATSADFRRIRTEVPALGYWHSERTVAIALPSGQSYRIEVYAPVEESRIRISRVIADASGANRHILFDDQVPAQGGSLSIVLENSVTSEGEPIQVDADGNGSFEGILSPAPAFSAMSTRPSVPFPDPLAIQATGYKSEGGDVEIDVRFPDFGASGWTWNAGETPDWIEVSRTEGSVPDSIVVTLRGGLLAAGSFEASFPVTLSRDGFETVHAVRVLFNVLESASLSRIVLEPETALLPPGGEIRFDAIGFDESERLIDVSPTWSASGGSIDSDGTFIAGGNEGTFTVTATDPVSQLTGEAIVEIAVATGLEHRDDADIPNRFNLHPSYPNPFQSAMRIPFDVSRTARVSLKIFDVTGRLVKILVDETLAPGTYEATFQAEALPSGLYLCRVEMDEYVGVRKMLLIK